MPFPDELYPHRPIAVPTDTLNDRPRWEYKLVDMPVMSNRSHIEAWFNEYGDDGWIHCDTRPREPGPYWILFRRRKA